MGWRGGTGGFRGEGLGGGFGGDICTGRQGFLHARGQRDGMGLSDCVRRGQRVWGREGKDGLAWEGGEGFAPPS